MRTYDCHVQASFTMYIVVYLNTASYTETQNQLATHCDLKANKVCDKPKNFSNRGLNV